MPMLPEPSIGSIAHVEPVGWVQLDHRVGLFRQDACDRKPAQERHKMVVGRHVQRLLLVAGIVDAQHGGRIAGQMALRQAARQGNAAFGQGRQQCRQRVSAVVLSGPSGQVLRQRRCRNRAILRKDQRCRHWHASRSTKASARAMMASRVMPKV